MFLLRGFVYYWLGLLRDFSEVNVFASVGLFSVFALIFSDNVAKLLACRLGLMSHY